MRAEVKV